MSKATAAQRWVYDDGGRADAGYGPNTDHRGDCVVRAITIATGLGYRQVHDLIDGIGAASPLWHGWWLGHKDADDGAAIAIVRRVLENELGWDYHPFHYTTRFVLHRLPAGRVVVMLSSSRHLCAVVDRVVRDLWDSSEGGRATLAGYWTKTGHS